MRARIEARYKLAIHRPRDMDKVRIALLKECDRPRFAEVARYSKPQGATKVTGPSIRFVEAALRCLGNIATETTVTLDDDIRRVIRVEVTDLETNVTHPKEIVVSKEIERQAETVGRSCANGRTKPGSRSTSSRRPTTKSCSRKAAWSARRFASSVCA